jgi:hypothetical protein
MKNLDIEMETRLGMTNSLSFIQRLGSAKQIMVPFGNSIPSPCYLFFIFYFLKFTAIRTQ